MIVDSKNTDKKLKELNQLSEDIKYIEGEFQGKLYGSCPDGDVKLHQLIDFAKEYDWLLEMVIKLSKKI